VRSVVSRFAAVGPTVLVLEDLHWADPTSLRLTRELAELAGSRPLLILATARPDASQEVASLADAPGAGNVQLRPLDGESAGALARSLLGDVTGSDVLAAALASAEGNPLFLEERLSSLIETGTLVRERGTWWLRDAPGPELPQVLERLVRSRVDRLGPAAQEAMRAASVLGAEFTPAVLAAVMGVQRSALPPVLDELTASDLVHPEPHGGGPHIYRFRHALIQEATYLGLLRSERRDLHARAAVAIEAAEGGRLPQFAGVLGRHYAIAEDPERAVRYFEMAGDAATDAFANEEAISSFRAALAVTARPAEVVRLQAKQANVLWRIARQDEARDAFREALRLAGSVDALQRAHLYTRLGRLELTELRYEAAAAAFDAAEALLGDDPGGHDDATADQWLEIMVDGRADMYATRLEPDAVLAILEAARPVLEERGSPARRTAFERESHLRLISLLVLTLTALRRHDTEAVRALCTQALEALDEADTRIAIVLTCQSWLAWQDGRPDEVLRLAHRIGEMDLTVLGTGARYRWVYLFPVIAARLATGDLAEAMTAAGEILHPEQQKLPDDLTAALESARAAWDRADQEAASKHLALALTLAHDRNFF
jgi:tetratricopeptide (TPR) repeat protein